MSALAPWILATAFGLAAALCAQLASTATLVLLLIRLYGTVRADNEVTRLYPCWTGQRRMWRVMTVILGLGAALWVGIALHWW